MNNYKLSEKGESLLKSIEALALKPYDDQKGINAVIKSWCKGATIGFGHLISQSEFNKFVNGINEEQANKLFESDIAPFVNCVNKVITKQLKQQEFDALVILAYNIGIGNFSTSSVVKMLNGYPVNTYKSLDAAWLSWNKSQGSVNKGLINRRNAELNIFHKGIYARW